MSGYSTPVPVTVKVYVPSFASLLVMVTVHDLLPAVWGSKRMLNVVEEEGKTVVEGGVM